jgi:hypothetical protein
MQKKNNTILQKQRKQAEAFLARVRREADEMEKLLRSSTTNVATRDALESVIVELSNRTGVGVTDPAVVGIFYLQATLQTCRDEETKRSVSALLGDIETLLNKPDRATARAIEQRNSGFVMADEENVVDLSCWRQSRPRPIKGGAQ